MMFHFSKGFLPYMFTKNKISEISDTYTHFFHSNLNLSQMDDMDTTFQIIMILLHFNPVNLMLKYAIIKLQSFTEIIIAVKEHINDLTKEKPNLNIESIISHLTEDSNIENSYDHYKNDD